MLRKASLILLIVLTASQIVSAQSSSNFIDFINQEHTWVDSVFNRLSKKDRIAQMFMVRAHTNLGNAYSDSVAKVIKKQKLGGVVLFQGGPVRHANLINRYQKLAKVPLLMALDGEWGLGMRLMDSTISFPYQMALGAVQDERLIYQMGQEIAKNFKRIGLNVNFAPDVDVNNNPNNPVINYRSFGENKMNVVRKGGAYMKGMMDGGLMTTLKHFPGHGDTDVDSHYDLPSLNFTITRLDSLEMYPFKELIKQGAPGVMVAHMNIPALDTTAHLPSSLSKNVITGMLKERMGFKGLTFTDAMDMKGVVKYFPDGEADVRAIIAGNDVLELSENSKRAIKKVRKAIRKKRLSWDDINARVKKILAAKYWMGLNQRQAVITEHLYQDLNNDSAKQLNQQLADAAITLLKGDTLIKQLDLAEKTALVSIGVDSLTTFQQILGGHFDNSLNFILSAKATGAEVSKVANELKNYKQVIVALHDTRLRPQSKLNYSQELNMLISELASHNVLFNVFANPYTIASFPGLEHAGGLVVAYQNDGTFQKAAAKLLSGQLKATGKLPITINSFFKYGDGL
ncbi:MULTISPECIES: glycoside hydrolase family 3 protein [Olivibacter]|jgi:beta-glucosidase-like glycosyl hydrolase|uniref:beta-N-acetylhexosaminidase n=2 Tax=Olivibacter TaxID=376469 RepID=A0ABV6HD77_9SPHI|nr:MULTISPECIES: glycoside hydrolase family 3 N-terminal domain-containing protein [Olivibacter]MDM8178070.1 glycoside hydrolase family 3 N-terminal domain-containing protein [Olivibacter sp. 47]MDX3916410.1 glycoside hydrolase family 3 N-terminal domain-containing protein [Pseudosphingobacterium sp.]QEK99372.1 glycoside hydrolase family 3 [Olivibacter sp. LS-1]